MNARMAAQIQNGYVEQLKQNEHEFNELKEELNKVNALLTETGNENQSQNLIIKELELTITDLQSNIIQIEEQNREEITKLETRVDEQASQIKDKDSVIESNKMLIQQLGEKLSGIETKLFEYKTFLSQLNSKLGIPEDVPFDSEETLKKFELKLTELENLKSNKAESEKKIAYLKTNIQALEDKNKELEETLKRIFPDPEEEEINTKDSSKLKFNETIKTVDRLFRFYENKLGFISMNNLLPPKYEDGTIKDFLSHLIQFIIKYKHFDIGSYEAKTNNFILYKSKQQRELPFVMVIKDFNPKDVINDSLKDFYTNSNSPTKTFTIFTKKYAKLFSIRYKSSDKSLEVLNQYTPTINLVEFYVSTDFIKYNIQYPYVPVADMGNKQDYKCTHTFKDMKHFHLIFESNIAYYIQMLQKKPDFFKITSESEQPLALLKGGEISRKPSPLLAKNYEKYVSILENVSYIMGIKYIRYLYYKKYKTSRSIQIENFCVSMMLSTIVYYIENYYLFELMTIDLIFSTLLFECTKNENTLLLPFFSPFLFID
jgi:hypothetical protein